MRKNLFTIITLSPHQWSPFQDVGRVLQTSLVLDQQGKAYQAWRLNCQQVSSILHIFPKFLFQTLIQKAIIQPRWLNCQNIFRNCMFKVRYKCSPSQINLSQPSYNPIWNSGDRDPHAAQQPQIHQGWTEFWYQLKVSMFHVKLHRSVSSSSCSGFCNKFLLSMYVSSSQVENTQLHLIKFPFPSRYQEAHWISAVSFCSIINFLPVVWPERDSLTISQRVSLSLCLSATALSLSMSLSMSLFSETRWNSRKSSQESVLSEVSESGEILFPFVDGRDGTLVACSPRKGNSRSELQDCTRLAFWIEI